MGRQQKKFHFIYKTTNIVNKKYYIGLHSTNNLNDGYLGSGKRLWYSLKKYGKENFKIEILEYLPDRKSLKIREKELVNEDLLRDLMCMNLQLGGEGGFINEEHQKKCSNAGHIGFKKKLEEDPEFKKRHSSWTSQNMIKLFNEGKLKRVDWTGKKHSEETKQKMRKSKNNGELNSQFGTYWITNGFENKKIKLKDFIPENWYKGRTVYKN